MSTENHTEEHHSGFKTYALVCLALFALTGITVYSAGFDFGDFNIVVAMVLASIKASIVAYYFMHLKFEDKLTWIYALYPLFLLFLLIGSTLLEVFTRVPVVR